MQWLADGGKRKCVLPIAEISHELAFSILSLLVRAESFVKPIHWIRFTAQTGEGSCEDRIHIALSL